MNLHHLGKQQSVFNQFIAEIRDKNIQKDSMRFRKNCERMGQIFAYEISKTLPYQDQSITTPLGTAQVALPKTDIVLATILRAGLPLHQGLHDYFDTAENCFIAAARKHHEDGTFSIDANYFASPSLTDKTVILSDPMLASGASILTALELLKTKGEPAIIHIVALIASQQGVNHVLNHMPQNAQLWVGAIDDELNDKAYIIPGLGDAGDLAYGTKL